VSDLGCRTISCARKNLGAPFAHHFKPSNGCDGGRVTLDSCMLKGLDRYSGFDCSGLIIISICDALMMDLSQWPHKLRHTQQIVKLASEGNGKSGDIRLYTSYNERIHIGLATGPDTAIHASGVSQKVEEGIVTDKYGDFVNIQHIPLSRVLRFLDNPGNL
jgi:hypothetical protein